MTGLEHITKVFKGSYSDVARKIGVTPATVSDWISKRRPITTQNLEKLSKLFRLDVKYFSENINEVEKIEVEIIYLNRLSKKESYQDSYMDLGEDGKEHEVTIWIDPYETELRMKHEDLAIEKLSLQMKGIMIHESYSSQFREDKHFRLLESITSILENDAFHEDEWGNVEPSSEDKKVEALINVVTILKHEENIFGFEGMNEGFEYELYSLFQKYKIIPSE